MSPLHRLKCLLGRHDLGIPVWWSEDLGLGRLMTQHCKRCGHSQVTIAWVKYAHHHWAQAAV
jgi:hypothetical protein